MQGSITAVDPASGCRPGAARTRPATCLLIAAGALLGFGQFGPLHAQNTPANPAEQCDAKVQALNGAVLALEGDLKATNEEFRTCRSDLAVVDQRRQLLDEKLERCEQTDTALRATAEQAREATRACEVARVEQERVWAEEKRKLLGELAYLKGLWASSGANPGREDPIAALRGQLDEQRGKLDASLRALANAADRIQAIAAQQPAIPPELGSADAQLDRERKDLEGLAANLFQRNREADIELRQLRQELERLRSAAGPAGTQCPSEGADAANQAVLSQCRSDLLRESARVAALSAERDQQIAERTLPRPAPVPDQTKGGTVPEAVAPAVPAAPTPTAPPAEPPAPAVDCTVKGRDLGLRGVPAGTYRLADVGLGDLAGRALAAPVTIAQPLCLMTRGVTVAEFSAFVSANPPAEQKRLGLAALQENLRASGDPGASAVGISWNVADAYAAWLSKTTGRRFALPERNDWLAAVAVWWRVRRDDAQAWTGARDLLAGRYDWLATACDRTGGKSGRALIGNVEGAPPAGGIRDLCRDSDLPPTRAGLRLKLLP